MPVALAILFTFLLNPVVSALQHRGLPRTPAVLLVVVLVFSVVGVGLLLATPMTVCLGVLSKNIPRIESSGVLMSAEPVLESPANYLSASSGAGRR
jgi:predicted PurR-regulated permease PerM